ncbi:MAG: hypothetical protein R2815_02190 [Flavobacteriales bacterium]
MNPERPKLFESAFRVVRDFSFAEAPTTVIRSEKPPEPDGQLERVGIKGFNLLLPIDFFESIDLGSLWSVSMEVSGHAISTNSARIVARGFTSTLERNMAGVTLSIDQFHSSETSATDQCFRRVVIPIAPKAFDSRHNQIQLTSYRTSKHWIVSRVPLALSHGTFDMMIHHHDEEHFLILDALQPCSLEELLHVSHDVALTLGYITGELAQTECFCFAYGSDAMDQWEHFSYHALRDSIKSSYAPVHANSYGYLSRDRREAERLHPLLRAISFAEFSSLCDRVMSDDAFASHLLLIQESMAASLVAMPPGLCVALEGLCRIATSQAKKAAEKTKRVPGEAEKKDPTQEILEAFLPGARTLLEKLRSEVNKDVISLIKKKLDNIGQPTNRAQLEAPFVELGFALNEEDVKAINARNRFLHGDVMLSKTEVDEANREAFYMALRLYCLLAVLILKPTGYDNRIVNYPRIHAEVYGKRIEEEHFRTI